MYEDKLTCEDIVKAPDTRNMKGVQEALSHHVEILGASLRTRWQTGLSVGRGCVVWNSMVFSPTF